VALSDSEWLAWLIDEEKDPVILVEAKYYDTTEKTLYLSDAGYIDPEDVDGSNYLPVITNDVVVDDQLGNVVYSDIEFSNFDDAVLDYQFIGFDIEIFYGDRTWPRDDFRQMGFTKTTDFLSPSPHFYRLRLLESGILYFDQPIKTKNGDMDPIGLPMVAGTPLNVRPLREDSTTFILYTPGIKTCIGLIVL
jgi:hypothetical protein